MQLSRKKEMEYIGFPHAKNFKKRRILDLKIDISRFGPKFSSHNQGPTI